MFYVCLSTSECLHQHLGAYLLSTFQAHPNNLVLLSFPKAVSSLFVKRLKWQRWTWSVERFIQVVTWADDESWLTGKKWIISEEFSFHQDDAQVFSGLASKPTGVDAQRNLRSSLFVSCLILEIAKDCQGLKVLTNAEIRMQGALACCCGSGCELWPPGVS